MRHRGQRPLYLAAAAILVTWLLAWTGYALAKRSRMTAERVTAYQNSLDLERMSAEQRRKALQALMTCEDRLRQDHREDRDQKNSVAAGPVAPRQSQRRP